MATITGTLLLADGSPLVCGMVEFLPISTPSIGADASVAIPLPVRATTDAAGAFEVDLVAGSYRMAADATRAFVEISVPAGDGDYALDEVAVDLPGAVAGTIRWGSDSDGDLADLSGLEGAITRASIGGDYSCSAGGYKWLVWPDSLGGPAEGTGIVDPSTGFAVSMAGSDEGFELSDNGWHYRIAAVSGVSCRVYRTRQAIGGPLQLRVTHG